MYLMYADESGDPGLLHSPTHYFVVSGIIIHVMQWHNCLSKLISFRQQLRENYGLRLREEFHASAFINSPGELVRIKRNDRLAMIRAFADFLSQLKEVYILNVVVDKSTYEGYDVFEMAWNALIQRFEHILERDSFNFHGHVADRGIIICDHTDDKKLVELSRARRRDRFEMQRNSLETEDCENPLYSIIEDPFLKDSAHSFFIQAADCAAFLLYQYFQPNNYMKKKSGYNYFRKLEPVLYREAGGNDPMGILHI
jgi:hypothetical protein